MLERRVPIQLGGMTDPFSPWEKSFGVTKSILELANTQQYPMVLSTKGDLVATANYLSRLKDGNYYVRISVTGANPETAHLLERGVPSVNERLAVVEKLSLAGINVSVRLQPIVPLQEDYLPALIKSFASAGAKHMSAEYLKWPIERNSQQALSLSKILPDAKKMYLSKCSQRVGREYILLPSYKLPHLRRMKALAEKAEIIFGFADNEFLHFNEFKSCCNAADLFLKDANFFDANLLTPLKTMSNGTASINSIKDRWAPSRNINPYLNSTVRVKNPDPTIGDWKSIITAKWNSESYNGGPGSFFGVEERLAQDLDGNKLFYLRGEKQQH